MPISGEMRLRQLILALIALSSIWVGVVAQRSHHTSQRVTALTSSSAQITWRTNVPTLDQTAFGLDAPTIWIPPSSASVIDHTSTITGLEFATTYTAYLHGVDEWNRAQTATVTFTTGPMLDQSNARTIGNSIVVDDRPFFATAVWQQCSDMFGSNIQ